MRTQRKWRSSRQANLSNMISSRHQQARGSSQQQGVLFLSSRRKVSTERHSTHQQLERQMGLAQVVSRSTGGSNPSRGPPHSLAHPLPHPQPLSSSPQHWGVVASRQVQVKLTVAGGP
jgi:hypothetical protein